MLPLACIVLLAHSVQPIPTLARKGLWPAASRRQVSRLERRDAVIRPHHLQNLDHTYKVGLSKPTHATLLYLLGLL